MQSKHLLFAPIAALAILLTATLCADPLTQELDIDFGRDVSSRDLKGLATRSDGAIVPGPTLTRLSGPTIAELLWTLEPDGPNRWLVGTGPDGRIVELKWKGSHFTVKPLVRLSESQVFAVRRLPDGSILAGTSPSGALYLIRHGKIVSRVGLPADSVFDILPLRTPGASPDSAVTAALVATGDPGRIYRVDLKTFAEAGVGAGKVSDPKALAAKGLTEFGRIHDQNVRCLARLPDGRVAAGSSPEGNVYLFPATGGAPLALAENQNAEVTDLLAQPNGDLYASIVYSHSSGQSRIGGEGAAVHTRSATMSTGSTPPKAPVPPTSAAQFTSNPPLETPPPAESGTERFFGRSKVEYFPAGGFPETLLSRSGMSFYRLARHGDLLIIAAGEQGQLMAWDLKRRLSLTLPGGDGSQLNDLVPVPGDPDRFLLLQNNAPGVDLLDFASTGERQLVTKRLDLGVPGTLGNLRFDALWNIAPADFHVQVRTSFGADETEGWTQWTPMAVRDDAFYAAGLRGRYLKLKIDIPADQRHFEIDPAAYYDLPEDRRPVLTDFEILPPNYALIPAPRPRPAPFVTLGQMLNANNGQGGGSNSGDPAGKNSFMSSQLVSSPGSQVVYWTVSDADGDTLAYTFGIKGAHATRWTNLAVNISDNYVQFDTSSLPDGLYRTQLIAAEQAPRPADQRIRAVFETDDLLVDHTPPKILSATAKREGDRLVVTVHGRDALSLLAGVEFDFNNGYSELVQHPVDGILDGRDETFQLRASPQKVTGATSVEVHLADQSGNTSSERLRLP